MLFCAQYPSRSFWRVHSLPSYGGAMTSWGDLLLIDRYCVWFNIRQDFFKAPQKIGIISYLFCLTWINAVANKTLSINLKYNPVSGCPVRIINVPLQDEWIKPNEMKHCLRIEWRSLCGLGRNRQWNDPFSNCATTPQKRRWVWQGHLLEDEWEEIIWQTLWVGKKSTIPKLLFYRPCFETSN